MLQKVLHYFREGPGSKEKRSTSEGHTCFMLGRRKREKSLGGLFSVRIRVSFQEPLTGGLAAGGSTTTGGPGSVGCITTAPGPPPPRVWSYKRPRPAAPNTKLVGVNRPGVAAAPPP